jgi:hypothetical protein
MSLLKVAGTTASSGTLYVNDVFSTYLYTGNSSTQTITNGIDLAGKGGLVWLKFRAGVNQSNNFLCDTVRGTSKYLVSDTTSAETVGTVNRITSFNSAGFSLGSNTETNYASDTYASWTFREAAKFFDVVTYTGDGTAGRAINHNLGVAPGMIIVKNLTDNTEWAVYHRDNGATPQNNFLRLNATNASITNSIAWNNTAPTISNFTLGSGSYTNPSTGVLTNTNLSGKSYVAYLFAHDTSSTGIIQCGSFVPSGATSINLGWEPQWVLYKCAGLSQDWIIIDSMRGWTANLGGQPDLNPNNANAETSSFDSRLTSTGFDVTNLSNGQTYIYMAIRRPNKPPTTGDQVFNPASGVSAYGIGRSNTSPDLFATFVNKTSPTSPAWMWSDRLRGFLSGGSPIIDSTSTAAENTRTTNPYFKVTEPSFGTALTLSNMPTANSMWYAFKRAPGFFDEVCYTGTGSATTQAHNLTVVPEFMIVKKRNSATNSSWICYCDKLLTPISGNASRNFLVLNATQAGTQSDVHWNSTTPTSSVFTVGASTITNGSADTFVCYLFATLAGISKVGSYTGNGTGQAIACGFSAGARFVLIKRTDSTGNWYTFDSARGLTSGSSPYLLLNSTAAETTGDNGVYASTGGFTLSATAITTTNIATATYIFLAVA